MLARSLFLTCLLVSFGTSLRADPPDAHTSLVGTWRLESFNRQIIAQPMYLQFHVDGTNASWPLPKDQANSERVAHGKYTLKGNRLHLDFGKYSGNDGNGHFEIKGDHLIMTSDEGDQLVYRRLGQDLKPGKLENGKPAGYLQNE